MKHNNTKKTKISLYRSSGNPIDPKHKELYLKAELDSVSNITKTLGKYNKDNADVFEEMLLQNTLKLQAKYPNKKRIEYPDGPKAIESLCKEYEGTIAFCLEGKKLIAYLMDQ